VEITIIVDQPYTRLAILLLKTCVWLVKDDCKFHIVLTFEQNEGTSLDTLCCKDVSSLARLSISLHRTLEVRRTSGNPPPTWMAKMKIQSILTKFRSGTLGGGFPLELGVFERVAEVRDTPRQGNSFKIYIKN
jgi:hypothetical protein